MKGAVMKRKRFSCSHAKGLCWVLILYNIWDSSILHAMVLSPWSRLVTDHRPGRLVDLEILSDLKILVGRDRDLRPRQRPQAEIPCKKSGPLCNSGMKWLHCWASRHSLGFEDEELVGRYCSYLLPKQAGGKTLRMTGDPTVYCDNGLQWQFCWFPPGSL